MRLTKTLLWVNLGIILSFLTACGGSGGGHSSSSNSSSVASSSTSSLSSESSSASSQGSSVVGSSELVVQVEDYLRYSDTTQGNTPGKYRSDDVDVEESADAGGGYDIAYIDAGEWLEYRLEVSSPGSFSLESRVASEQSGGGFALELDGEPLGEAISVSATGGWQTWASLTQNLGSLAVGSYALCVQMSSGPFNLNWLKFSSADGGALALGTQAKGDTSSCIHAVEPPQVTVPSKIKLNQLGFLPNAQKLAVVPAVAASQFQVLKAGTEELVLTGDLTAAADWEPALESVKLADFSSLTAVGDYELKVAGVDEVASFTIGSQAYNSLNAAAIKAYYFNRASTALLEANAGVYARAAGHPDNQVYIHASAADDLRPEGTLVSAPKGWYDAGDYNKYVVNSGITTYTLLAAFEHFPAYFSAQSLNIPESGDAVPDLLDEAMWNLEWLLAMQDPNDGGVYHKLTSKGFSGFVMPADDTSERYMVQKTTAAALDFAAVMATASRVYAAYESQFPGKSAQMLNAAKAAWAWAKAHPAVYYSQPADVQTGEYGDSNVSDEFAWAAAELYVTTGEDPYYSAIGIDSLATDVPWWGGVGSLAWVSLAQHLNQLSAAADKDLIKSKLDGLAAGLVTKKSASAYGVSMELGDFSWGSNSGALNQAFMLTAAYQLDTSKRAYLDAAQALLDYVLGRNATDYAFVTGFGAQSPLHIHHRPSAADGVDAPVPGFVVGGPHADHYGDCTGYPSPLAAKSYLDSECSYTTNEIAINWNAPLVYVSAALEVLTPGD